jgi:hypothetical protein
MLEGDLSAAWFSSPLYPDGNEPGRLLTGGGRRKTGIGRMDRIKRDGQEKEEKQG